MAKQSIEDVACARLDAKIDALMVEAAALTRAKELIRAGSNGEPAAPKPRKPRGPNKRKPGLPASETAAVS